MISGPRQGWGIKDPPSILEFSENREEGQGRLRRRPQPVLIA
jgi:hypothetical protein